VAVRAGVRANNGNGVPKAEPWIFPVFCFFGEGHPMMVRSLISDGLSVTALSAGATTTATGRTAVAAIAASEGATSACAARTAGCVFAIEAALGVFVGEGTTAATAAYAGGSSSAAAAGEV